jgi:Glycosyltransferases involved in cell wall biogenesis
MKTIIIVVPTYNEQENVNDVYDRIFTMANNQLKTYNVELLFIDNSSNDNTRNVISALCEKDYRVKAIFNAKNFGYTRSIFYGLTQATGDCAILMNADLQDPPEVIPEFVRCWENGYKIVAGIKNKSRESKFMYFARTFYYKMIRKISEIEHIEHFDGFGLYDSDFINVLRNLNDSLPYLRGIVAELGFQRKDVYYEQQRREKGKTNFNFLKLYDLAMLGITSYSKAVMRVATFLGFTTAAVSLLIAIATFIVKLVNWNSFPIGTAAISIGVFFFGSVQLCFIGLLGEYITNINTRVMQRPLVIEEKRINFDVEQKEQEL